jgi:hypothetical protein
MPKKKTKEPKVTKTDVVKEKQPISFLPNGFGKFTLSEGLDVPVTFLISEPINGIYGYINKPTMKNAIIKGFIIDGTIVFKDMIKSIKIPRQMDKEEVYDDVHSYKDIVKRTNTYAEVIEKQNATRRARRVSLGDCFCVDITTNDTLLRIVGTEQAVSDVLSGIIVMMKGSM